MPPHKIRRFCGDPDTRGAEPTAVRAAYIFWIHENPIYFRISRIFFLKAADKHRKTRYNNIVGKNNTRKFRIFEAAEERNTL